MNICRKSYIMHKILSWHSYNNSFIIIAGETVMLLFIIFILSFIKETSQSIKLEEIH